MAGRLEQLLFVALLSAPWAMLGAQSSCPGVGRAAAAWQAPLDREIDIGPTVMRVRDAIDRAASAAKVYLTYSPELLPNDRLICIGADPARLGDALAQWLSGTRLQPVVAGDARVVLALARPVTLPTTRWGDAILSSTQLAPVVVREAGRDETLEGASVPRTLVTAEQLEASGAPTLAQALSGSVPGFWMWAPSSLSVGGGVVSVRGASSFGANYPKVYVDGVEVANPLFLSQLATDQIAEVEVIRGPQGSALYGAGAIGGVISITTSSPPVAGEGSRMSVRSSAGLSESAFSPLGAFVQDHSFSAKLGSVQRSAGLGLSTSTVGAFIPGAFSQQLHASAAARFLGSRSRLQLTARVFAHRVGNATSPLLSGLTPLAANPKPAPGALGTDHQHPLSAAASVRDSASAQRVREYTIGGTYGVQGDRWVHSVTTGVDGYRLHDVSVVPGMVRTPGDSALLAASGGADRASLRWTSEARYGIREGVAAHVTVGADHSLLRDASLGTSFGQMGGQPSAVWRHTSGATAVGEITLVRSVAINGGLRLERNSGFTVLSGVAALPSLGAAFRRDIGGAAVTLRTAYGKAIQPPRVATRASAWGGRVPTVMSLQPEEQTGVEFGADVSFGSRFTARVTRYDQRATDLIQPVASGVPLGARGVSYQLQNVGAITNRGWELEGSLGLGALTLTGALGLTDSRVERVADTYSGDLRAGDRVLQIPASTLSLSASWLGRGWSGSWSLARASDWINYDWLALATDSHASPQHRPPGGGLRQYWRSYRGVTRLRAAFSRDLTNAFGLVMSGDNLLGQQLGEPDNVTIVPGRTIRAGVRAKF
ncbi:MAG: TonB-dependent receptor plug domain-containing protein [Gemmatimonadaceae bacterium]